MSLHKPNPLRYIANGSKNSKKVIFDAVWPLLEFGFIAMG